MEWLVTEGWGRKWSEWVGRGRGAPLTHCTHIRIVPHARQLPTRPTQGKKVAEMCGASPEKLLEIIVANQ